MKEWERKPLVTFYEGEEPEIDYERITKSSQFEEFILYLQSCQYGRRVDHAVAEFFRMGDGSFQVCTAFGDEEDLEDFKLKLDKFIDKWDEFKVNMLEAISLTTATGKRQTIDTLDGED